MKNKKWICRIGTLAVCLMLVGCGSNEVSIGSENAAIDETENVEIVDDTEAVCEHEWIDATCAEPKHCSICGEIEGEPLEHTLTEANYQQAAACEVCGETVGEPLQAEFEKYGLVCNAELDVTYPYVIPCYDEGYTTNGKVTFSDYDVFESDETHEALDGYEWKAVTCTVIFDDESAYNHGYSGIYPATVDYYDATFLDNYEEKKVSFVSTYNGEEYDGIQYDKETLQSGWNDDVFTYQYRDFYRVPKGYDGIVMAMYNPSVDWNIGNDYEVTKANDDTILFRLK